MADVLRIHPDTGEITDDPMGVEVENGDRTLEGMEPSDFIEGVVGTEKQLNFTVGSAFSVNRSTLVVPKPPAINVKEGQFKEGDTLTLTMEVEVEKVHFDPIYDSSKNKLGVERKHVAKFEQWMLGD